MNRCLCQLQPALEIIPNRAEKKIADRMADRLDIFARASVRVGGEMSVDVDVADGRGVEDDSPAVAGAEPVELVLVLGEGLGPEVVEEFVVGVGPVDDLGQLAQLDLRDVGEEWSIWAVDPGKVGVALEDRPGEERAREGGIPALGIFSETFQPDTDKPDRHPVAVGEPVKLELVAEEPEGFDRIPALLDQQPRLRKPREDFIQILVFGLFGHRGRL